MEINRERCILHNMSMGRMGMHMAGPNIFYGSLLNNTFRAQLIKFFSDALLFHGRALNILIMCTIEIEEVLII